LPIVQERENLEQNLADFFKRAIPVGESGSRLTCSRKKQACGAGIAGFTITANNFRRSGVIINRPSSP
jgi:hypothetical protein